MKEKRLRCLLCNSADLEPSKGRRGVSIARPKTFRYYKCIACEEVQCIPIKHGTTQ